MPRRPENEKGGLLLNLQFGDILQFDGLDGNVKEMGLAAGDGAVLYDQGIEIEGGPGAIRFSDADGSPCGQVDGLGIAFFVQADNGGQVIAFDAARKEKVGRYDKYGRLFLGAAVGKLFEQTLGGKMVGGAAGKEDGNT